MAPSAISNGQGNGSDVDLIATAIDHKMEDIQNGHANGATDGQVVYQELDASKLTYSFTKSPQEVPPAGVTSFDGSSICTDHMLTATWNLKTGWATPEIKPFGPFSIMPTASVLHYATECFEGLKAYRGFDGKLRLFRPDCNAERLLVSSVRISLPSFPPAEVEKLIKAFMAVDGPKWLPRDRPGSFIYLRPTLIGTHSQLGVQAPSDAMLFILASYMPPMDAPAGGMKLHTSPADMVRAWAGGFGYAKVGANYGPSLLATAEAKTRGFHQILWLYGEQGFCTEAGASNFFVVWKNKETGKTELVTAPLGDKIILDGVTRRSVLQLIRERCAEDVEVVERKYTIDEILEAHAEGRLVESFASGTAVSHSSSLLSILETKAHGLVSNFEITHIN
jgi:branched-chain amino acid aminotransferase